MPKQLAQFLNETTIHGLAGERAAKRGLEYFTLGHVKSCTRRGEHLSAMVRGSRDYEVSLEVIGGELAYSCDCPVGEDGDFCKHCVAVALEWLNGTADAPRQPIGLAEAAETLRREDHETLVSMPLDWAAGDRQLEERLILYATRRANPETGAAAIAQAFRKACAVDEYADWREAATWAHGVDAVIDEIDRLRQDGHGEPVMNLCESGLRLLVEAIERIDDSDGYFSMLQGRLGAIHLQACERAKPDPIRLAEKLFSLERNGECDAFSGAAERYAALLGEVGLEAYGALAEAEWDKVPMSRTRGEGGGDFRITRIMETLARMSGDVERMVAVKTRDLSYPGQYLRIAEIYRQARDFPRALSWAEKGLDAFPKERFETLAEFAAVEYQRCGRHDAAMALIWAEFARAPYLGNFQRLEVYAAKASAWPEWRARAFEEIRERKPAGDNHSTLVEIYLHENDPDQAWKEALDGGCSDRLWLRLAESREELYPQEAGTLYLRIAEEEIARTTGGRYEGPVALLLKSAALMKSAGRGADFVTTLDRLRAKYKIKRNFTKLVELKRKLLYL